MRQAKEPAAANILIVDDTPANLQLLAGMLKERGYKARPVSSGAMAIEAAWKQPPDLILLDINMPDMDGYEVCRCLKANLVLKEIPIIFISALNETLDKVKAFSAGGVDYVTKPFQFDEVDARVKTHLELRRLRLELEESNARLEEQVRLRTLQLAEANSRLALVGKVKNDFLTLIARELEKPLNGLFGVVDLVFDGLMGHPAANELREYYSQSKEKIAILVEDALLLGQMEVDSERFLGTPASFDLALTGAIVSAGKLAKSRGITFGVPPEYSAMVVGEADVLLKALAILLETAVRWSEPGSAVQLYGKASDSQVRLTLQTKGCTIPVEAVSSLFDVEAISSGSIRFPGSESALRLPVAERILTLFGGSLTIENHASGIQVCVCLNRYEEPASNEILR